MERDSVIVSRRPPSKEGKLSARFEYQKMTAREFSAALREIDLPPDAFARIFGVRKEVVARWLKGTQDVPPWVFVVLWILREVPNGIAIARTAAANHIAQDRKYVERGPFPYLTIPDDEEDS